jgi:hypothetical protein
VPFEELAIRRLLVDIPFGNLDLSLVQKTSGVAAGSSSGLPEERRFGHGGIVDRWRDGQRMWIDADGHGPRICPDPISKDPH